jgi:Mg-chelatase subunit ChlD
MVMRHSIQKSNTAVVAGSLTDIAKQTGTSLAETFLGADVIVLVDTSSSMAATDAPGGLSRYDAACKELANLQATIPGKVAVISFSGHSSTMFCPNGQPYNLQGGTDLAGALKFAKVADVSDMRFVVISDGQPDSETEALNVARTYTNRIDTIFVGPEVDHGGRAFLARLATAKGGQSVTADRVAELSSKVQLLLAA